MTTARGATWHRGLHREREASPDTGAELGIGGQVEQRQIASALPQLQANANRPDITQLEGSLLANELALVPRLSLLGSRRNLQLGLRWCAETR